MRIGEKPADAERIIDGVSSAAALAMVTLEQIAAGEPEEGDTAELLALKLWLAVRRARTALHQAAAILLPCVPPDAPPAIRAFCDQVHAQWGRGE